MLEKRIKEDRKNKKLTQKELGKILGVSQQAVAKWESGTSEPNSIILKLLANLFGVSVDNLLGNGTEYCMNNKLRELRKSEGLLQKDIAKVLNVSVSTYSYWEMGKFDIDLKSLQKLADFFNVSIDYILCRDYTEEPSNFSTRLKELREQKGISQSDLANILQFSQSAIGNWESAKREPNLNVLQTIADYFGVSVDFLLGRESIEKPKAEHFINFSTRLKELRENKGLTQIELAKALNVGIATIGMWESSKRTPPAEKLLVIAKFFDVTIDSLLGSEKIDKINAKKHNVIAIFGRNGIAEEIEFSDEDLAMAKNILKAIKEKNKAEPKDF